MLAQDLGPVQAGCTVIPMEDVLAIGVEDGADVRGKVQVRALGKGIVVHTVVVGVCAIHASTIRI
jgi:hypothetical protein